MLQLDCGRPTLPFDLPWFLRHLLVRFAWKIPSSSLHYLRNIEIKLKIKRTPRNSNTEIPEQFIKNNCSAYISMFGCLAKAKSVTTSWKRLFFFFFFFFFFFCFFFLLNVCIV